MLNEEINGWKVILQTLSVYIVIYSKVSQVYSSRPFFPLDPSLIEPTAYSIPDFGISVGLSHPRVETRISPKSALPLTVPILTKGGHLPSCPREKPRYQFLLFPLSELIYSADHLIMHNQLPLRSSFFPHPQPWLLFRLSPTLIKQVQQPPNRPLQFYVPSI